ncbi:MAG: hypothetical protein HZC15_01060 [Candidatus Omnitrophica bacterium]|nr:hypothetical protein [Candidatus Omnitrophota bacterium]
MKRKIFKVSRVLLLILSFVYCAGLVYGAEDLLVDRFSKEILQAKNTEEINIKFEEASDAFFKEHKYNEFVDLLNSLIKQKNELAGRADFYIALSRYNQLRYLEEAQSWDEYFNKGNEYRDQIVQSAQKSIAALPAEDPLMLDVKLVLWKFHRDQQDNLRESSLEDLMQQATISASNAKNAVNLKNVADQLQAYGEKLKARELYKLYSQSFLANNAKDEELLSSAQSFYKDGNIELSESIYDIYIKRLVDSGKPKDKIIPALVEIAKSFSFNDDLANDPAYAEKMFKQIESVGGKEAFDEQLVYLRAYNLEKAKDYTLSKDVYLELLRFPGSVYSDEAIFKAAFFNAYALRDLKSARELFEKLAQKESPVVSAQVASSLYQLGLLAQCEGNKEKAKEYYNKLLGKALDPFVETQKLAKERLSELEEDRPIEYNLKTFLDASFKDEYTALDMSKIDLKSSPSKAKKDEAVAVESLAYASPSGCMQVELQYLWSGNIGKTPSVANDSATFNTSYIHSGTKEINLVVVSPSGIVERSFTLEDVN